MTTRHTTVAPPNSLILVMDRSTGAVPDTMAGHIAFTESCVAIGTLCELDGDTYVAITDDASAVPGTLSPVFVGDIDTPTRVVAVYTVQIDVLLQLPVVCDKTRLRIFTDDDSEPQTIYVLVQAQ